MDADLVAKKVAKNELRKALQNYFEKSAAVEMDEAQQAVEIEMLLMEFRKEWTVEI